MSRIGRNPISVPSGVDFKVDQAGRIAVKGPKGELSLETLGRVAIDYSDGRVVLDRPDDSQVNRAYHGLYQRLLANMVKGVTDGFTKGLEIQGVGYRAEVDGKTLVCHLGYSHPIRYTPPGDITIKATDPTHLQISGPDKQAVGQVAAIIRSFRKPEPYKGKGVRYVGEYVRRKAGKKSAK